MMKASVVFVIIIVAILGIALVRVFFIGYGQNYIERYQRRTNIFVGDIGNSDYHNFVIGGVFVSARLVATDSTTHSGRPPYSILVSAYLTGSNETRVEIVDAVCEDNTGVKYNVDDILVGKLSLEKWNQSSNRNFAASKFIETDFLIDSSPKNGEVVRLYLSIEVEVDGEVVFRDLEFVFDPIYKKVKRKGLPF